MHDYASIHWGTHFRKATRSEHMASLAKHFLLSENGYLGGHKRIPWEDTRYGRPSPRNVTGAHVAGHFGLQSLMTQLAAAGEGLDIRDENGETPLLWAARNKQPDVVVWLVEQGADTSVVDFNLRTAHHYAVENKWKMALRALLNKGVVISQDIYNMTPIHHGVLISWEYGVESLLSAGVSINTRVQIKGWGRQAYYEMYGNNPSIPAHCAETSVGFTPLHFASLARNLRMTQYLLLHGADPTIVYLGGNTPLHFIFYPGQHLMRCIVGNDVWSPCFFENEAQERYAILHEMLVHPKANANIQDVNGASCLHVVYYQSSDTFPKISDFVKLLLEKGKADPNLQNRDGRTSLLLACWRGDVESLEVLLDHGACLTARDNYSRNAMHFAARSGDIQIITAVGTHVNTNRDNITIARDADGRNALHHLLENSPTENSLEYLLGKGVGVNDLDHKGYSPLMTMVNSECTPFGTNFTRLAQRLVRAGAEISIRCPKTGLGLHHININSPFFDLGLMKYLASLGLSLHDKDEKGRTLLHHGATSGHMTSDAFAFLLEKGLDLDEVDGDGKTPLDCNGYGTRILNG